MGISLLVKLHPGVQSKRSQDHRRVTKRYSKDPVWTFKRRTLEPFKSFYFVLCDDPVLFPETKTHNQIEVMLIGEDKIR